MSASYDRVMDIITALGNNVCEYYHQIGTVCPPPIKRSQFITANNVDHNPSSATSTGSFHGTNLSLFQNVTTESVTSDDGDRGFTHSITPSTGQRKIKDLSIAYSEIKPTYTSYDGYVPPTAGILTFSCAMLSKLI